MTCGNRLHVCIPPPGRRDRTAHHGVVGFSVVELLVALTISLAVTAAVFAMLNPAGGAFQAVPEASDVQQRLSSATDTLVADLLSAGSLPIVTLSGASQPAAPPVFPMRIGRRSPDPVGTVDTTRIAIWSVTRTAAQTTLATALPSSSGSATIAIGPWCPQGDASCGFRTGMTVVVIDRHGAWDLFSVTAVSGRVISLQHDLRDDPARVYPAGDAAIAEATFRTYQFKDDRTTGVAQLVRYDGAAASDQPVIDHIVGLGFQYFGDADPPTLLPGASVWDPPRPTYGPLPPSSGSQPTAYPAGENCTFTHDAGGAVVPRLTPLGVAATQVALSTAELTDGPWCPDSLSANRYDADLLRVRTVVVSLRIESAITALRGPAGPLFSRAGTARGSRVVPDREVRLAVTPRGAARAQ